MTTTSETLMNEVLIDAPTLATKLNVHEVTIRKWQVSGKIPAPVRIGRTVKWRPRNRGLDKSGLSTQV